MTPIADMIEKLSADGVPMASILLAVRTAEQVAAAGKSGGIPVDAAAEKRRAYDRERKRNKANSTGVSTGIPPEQQIALSSSSNTQVQEIGKERKKEAAPRSRGHGLSDDWHPSESHYRIGADLHRSNADVDQEADAMRLWAKANAHRAVARKSDWESTFTGWLRRTWGQTGATNGQRSNHANRKSPGGDFFAGLAEVAAGLDRDGSMAGPADENIPSGRVNIEH